MQLAVWRECQNYSMKYNQKAKKANKANNSDTSSCIFKR